jgi:hypothetical protein
VEADAGEGEAASGAWVLGEDLGDKSDSLPVLAAEVAVGTKVERRGAPERTPPAGDGLRAGAVLGEEEGSKA